MQRIVIKSTDFFKEIALIDDGKVVEFLFDSSLNKEEVGNFYKAKIVDKIEALNTIFVDIGFEKKAFLSLRKFENIDNFKIDDEILVQIKKEQREEKGAEVTLDFSITGKNLVLLPNSKKISLSNKIENTAEKERLYKLFNEINVENIGLIIRTSATNVDSAVLNKEYNNLILKWKDVLKNYSHAKSGKLVYRHNNILEKIFREYFDINTEELIVDDEKFYEKILRYIDENNLEIPKNKIRRFFKNEDIFSYFALDVELDNALKKKLWLKSGAYLFIEKTQALISIDVNSGRNIENKKREETALHTNIEAAIEIARQLRLRNLAGIIIIDFIDMKKNKDRNYLLKILKENLSKDRLKPEINSFSSLNLIQLTRKREGRELSFYFNEVCPHCGGNGFIESEEKRILNFLHEIKELSKDRDIKKIELKAEEKFINKIKKDFIEYIDKILENKKIEFTVDKNYENNAYKINLYK